MRQRLDALCPTARDAHSLSAWVSSTRRTGVETGARRAAPPPHRPLSGVRHRRPCFSPVSMRGGREPDRTLLL